MTTPSLYKIITLQRWKTIFVINKIWQRWHLTVYGNLVVITINTQFITVCIFTVRLSIATEQYYHKPIRPHFCYFLFYGFFWEKNELGGGTKINWFLEERQNKLFFYGIASFFSKQTARHSNIKPFIFDIDHP